MKSNMKNIKYLISIVVGILTLTSIYISSNYKVLIFLIGSLGLLNILMFLKLLKNNNISSFIWNGIESWIDIFKNEEKTSYYITREVFNKKEIKVPINNNYEKLIDKINHIALNLKRTDINIKKNEKVNMELINNLTEKLNNPLEDILTLIDKIKLQENNREEIKNLKTKSNNLKKLVEELFEASKTSTGDMKVELNNIEITEFLKQAIVEVEDRLMDNNLVVRSNFPKEETFLSCSGEMLWRVFEILFENIIKHSLENSRVYLDVKKEDKKLYIILKNTSKKELNIEPKDLVHIINNNKSEDVSGLGLEIAKNLVLLQNGNFKIDIDGDLFKVTITFNLTTKDEVSLDKGVI